VLSVQVHVAVHMALSIMLDIYLMMDAHESLALHSLNNASLRS
jgi:hypothetical protein